jgi:hypothetical protein
VSFDSYFEPERLRAFVILYEARRILTNFVLSIKILSAVPDLSTCMPILRACLRWQVDDHIIIVDHSIVVVLIELHPNKFTK